MNLYNRLIENPLFFKWIYHSTNEIEAYWVQYLKSNPAEAKHILEFKSEFEKHFNYEVEKLSDIEKKALAHKIICKLEETDKRKNRFSFVRVAMRYAALAFLFLSIGGALVYYYMSESTENYAIESFSATNNISEPVLIIGDDERIPLNNQESELVYSANGELVINDEKHIDDASDSKIPTMNTLVIPYGNRSVVSLGDGTKVWLNAGSRLIYPSKFVDKTREVYLVGEAFFEVKENKTKPFIVKTSDMAVKVWGTKFNVSAYPEDKSIQAVLTEGSVEILNANAGMFEKGIFIKPGQLASLSKIDQLTRVYDVDVDYYTLWTEGIFSFTNTDLNRLVKKLERYYNIRFEYVDPMDGLTKISGKLDVAKEQTEVFEYMSRLTGLEFRKINDWKYIIK